MALKTRPIAEKIATEVEADIEELVAGAHSRELLELLEQRGVLVFPRLHMSDAQQLAFARTLGDVIEQGENGIFKVSLDPAENAMADYLKGTVLWHFDGWSDDVPTKASLLSAHRVSPVGGQTEFANTYAAYGDLDPIRKSALERLEILHTMIATLEDVFPDASPDFRADWDKYPQRVHPLVWTHRSRRKSLVLGSSADQVVGLDQARGRDLIQALMAWSTQSQFVYRHEWNVGDLVIWDNTGALHRVESYPAASGRLMHRTTLVGEEAIS